MKTLFTLLLFFIAASTWHGQALDHSPRWFGNTVKYGPNDSLNGLVDLDNFPVGDYGYCKWGVLQDAGNYNTVTLDFTRLTAGPFANDTKDLFLQRTANPSHLFPSDAVWNPANGSYQKGKVTFTQFPGLGVPQSDSINVALFRYLHFNSFLFATDSDGNESFMSALRPSTKKLIVLFHGWNPDSNFNSYAGDVFASLESQLRSQIAGTDWVLSKYHWEEDADTGPGFPSVLYAGAVKNGTKAAEIAHQHGQHFGELLNETCPKLESIQLIAHSAGSWAARAAAKFLLSQNPNLIVEVTLLDPFIPGAAGELSSLTRENMSAMAQFQGNDRIFQLENYYSHDITGSGTEQPFDWRLDDIKDYRVDWSTHYGDSPLNFKGHDGPIQFYSDTVASTVPGATPPSNLTGAPYYAADGKQIGWWRSLFWNEPVFDQQPQTQPVDAGQKATFTIQPNTRRERFNLAEAAGLTVQWQKDGKILKGETFTTLTVANATADSAGEYVAIVSNAAGRTKSNPAILTVNGGSGTPTITLQPKDQPAIIGQTATFTVVATGTGPLSYQWKRNGADISGAIAASYKTTPVSLIHDGYTYQVVVTDSQGSKPSRVATLDVLSATGSCSDPNEPNDSSLTATPLAFGTPTSGYICTTTDVDWFRLPITTNSLLTVNLNVPAGLDYDLEIYGPDNLWRAGSYGPSGQDEVITTPVSPGNYYLRVYGHATGSGDLGQTQPYQLNATFLELPVSGTVAGTLTDSVTWGGVVDLTGDVTVPAGATLTILPGTLVRCHAGGDSGNLGNDASRVEIIVDGGLLQVAGTIDSPVLFTSGAVNKDKGQWAGIRVVNGDVTLRNFTVEYATTGLSFEDATTRFQTYVVEHGTLRFCNTGFQQTADGDALDPLRLSDMHMVRNDTGVSVGTGSLTLDHCESSSNASIGISGLNSRTTPGTLMLTSCSVTNNGPSGGLNASYKKLVLADSDFRRNTGPGVYYYAESGYNGPGGFEMRNCTVRENSAGVTVAGNIGADITLVGNTISDHTGVGLDWQASGSSRLGADGIKGNTIRNNQIGVHVGGGAPSVLALSGNDIYGNREFEIKNDSNIPITAANCYWGDPTSTELNQNQANLSRIYDQMDNGSYGLVTVLNSRFAPINQAVVTAPTVTQPPQTQTVLAGSTVTFTVAVSGTAPFGYQWRKGESNITGATNASLGLANVQAGNAGAYSVIVSNSAGTATSAAAILTVTPLPANLAVRTITRSGGTFAVSLAVSPPTGAAASFVEETLPVGFTVAGLNNGGTFNATTRKILWGPLASGQTWPLAYTLQPPAGFQNSAAISGVAYFFGTGTPVTGDTTVTVPPPDLSPRIKMVKVAGFFAVSIEGQVGKTYRLEATDDVTALIWDALASLKLTQSPRVYVDGDSLGNPRRFYRAVLVE